MDPVRAQMLLPHTVLDQALFQPPTQTAAPGAVPRLSLYLAPLWADLGIVEMSQAPQALRVPSLSHSICGLSPAPQQVP